MISIVEPVVIHHKNMRILDGCTSIILQLRNRQRMRLTSTVQVDEFQCADHESGRTNNAVTRRGALMQLLPL